MKRILPLVVIALVASMVMATQPTAVRHHVDRATCVFTHTKHANAGARDHCRVAKGETNSGEQPLLDWDMAAVQLEIDTQLAVWGKTFTEARDLDMINIRHEIATNTSGLRYAIKEINLQTVMSTNDWWEGDGVDWDLDYNWASTPYAATWYYAGDSFFYPDVIPWLSPLGGWTGGWEDPDTGDPCNPYVKDAIYRGMEFKHLFHDWDPDGAGPEPAVPRGTRNSTQIIGLYQTVDLDDPPDGTQADEVVWSGTRLDDAFWYELIYDDNCVGTRQYGDMWFSDHPEYIPEPWPDDINPNDYSYDNASFCLPGQWGGIAAPSLVIEVKPHDGDTQPDGAVNLLDLIIVANNWQQTAKQWEDGDFNGDTDVNLLDLILLANEWNWSAGGAGGAVPEPACLVVLGLGALALIRRRRR